MFQRRRFQPILFSLVTAAALLAGHAQAGPSDRGPSANPAKVRGKWRIAWDVRLGTVRGILTFKQSVDQVTGTFEEYGQKFPLSGNIQGHAITFDIPFSGPRPYTIEFKGIVDGDCDEMTGTSASKGGPVFLGHAGEVDEPQRPWTATKGLKRPNNSPDKPPDDDDDDDRRRPARP